MSFSIRSAVVGQNGRPTLTLNGQAVPPIAYTTYFHERSCHRDFLKSGVRIFFVNVSFTVAPINSVATGFSPFRVGVFEEKEKPDYSELDDAARAILRDCPEAVIFPRINVSMPRWWIDEHPAEIGPTPKGGLRELLFSDAFRRDGEDMLVRLIDHVRKSDYAPRVGGWQLCGGLTQEWLHHDANGGLCPNALPYFQRWMKKEYGIENASIPDPAHYLDPNRTREQAKNAERYARFSDLGLAESLEHFARVVKRETEGRQIVGAFYGYAYVSNRSATLGSHALSLLVDSPALDFFSSPNAYTRSRAFGIDWADMLPVDTVRSHEKLCFIECDIRTHLTCAVQDCRPGEYPDHIYRLENGKSVWSGPPTAELSRLALRKCFAHQLTKASAIWWFDMWGGWYHDPMLMDEIARLFAISEGDLAYERKPLSPSVVFFADEEAFGKTLSCSDEIDALSFTRTEMGLTGVPFLSCLTEDAPRVLTRPDMAAIFPMTEHSESGARAMALCRERGIPYLCATKERARIDAEELRRFYEENGIFCYTERVGDVVYLGNGYLGLHSTEGGQKEITLPFPCETELLLGGTPLPSAPTRVRFSMEENDTALLRILPV